MLPSITQLLSRLTTAPTTEANQSYRSTPFTENIELAGQSPEQLRPAQPPENPAPAEPSMFNRLLIGAGNLFTSIFGNTNPPRDDMTAVLYQELIDITPEQLDEARRSLREPLPPIDTSNERSLLEIEQYSLWLEEENLTSIQREEALLDYIKTGKTLVGYITTGNDEVPLVR